MRKLKKDQHRQGSEELPHKSICRLMLISLIMVMLVILSACGSAAQAPEPAAVDPVLQPDVYRAASTNLAWSGNLHYQNFVIYGDGLTFISAEDGLIASLDTRRMTVNKLIGNPGCQFAWHDGWLFYAAGQLSNTVRKIMTDGTNSVRISTFSYQYLIASQDYLMGILTSTGQVMRMDHDGTRRQTMFDGFATELQYDGQFLYVCGSQDKTGLIRIDPETGVSARLLDRRISSLNKVGDWYYFADLSDQQRVHAWSEVEGNDLRVTEFSLTRPFIVYDSWLYYLDTEHQNRLMRLPVSAGCAKTDQCELVVDDAISSFVILPDAIFYRRPDTNRIYRVPLPGGDPVRIS
ncbi:MAG: DUF5050 domain-containing protein [Bacillota bacterium]|nr:DUF5050 domain-containing protein [Bacillota bacterium]